jgi:hypothetical protein
MLAKSVLASPWPPYITQQQQQVRKLKSENLYAAIFLLAAGVMPRLQDDCFPITLLEQK